ncbi:hypothetical protein D9M72_494990 [compost metagenome]
MPEPSTQRVFQQARVFVPGQCPGHAFAEALVALRIGGTDRQRKKSLGKAQCGGLRIEEHRRAEEAVVGLQRRRCAHRHRHLLERPGIARGPAQRATDFAQRVCGVLQALGDAWVLDAVDESRRAVCAFEPHRRAGLDDRKEAHQIFQCLPYGRGVDEQIAHDARLMRMIGLGHVQTEMGTATFVRRDLEQASEVQQRRLASRQESVPAARRALTHEFAHDFAAAASAQQRAEPVGGQLGCFGADRPHDKTGCHRWVLGFMCRTGPRPNDFTSSIKWNYGFIICKLQNSHRDKSRESCVDSRQD